MIFPARLRAVSPAAGRSPSLAGPLLGMYVLLVTALACVGAAAGELFFTADRTLSLPFDKVLNRCLLRFPMTAGYLSGLDRCTAGIYRSQGMFVLGAAAAVPVITAGLIFAVPWVDRRRLARVERFTDIPGVTAAVTARFEALCGQAGLTGRRRPQLLVAGVREAFTTALPGGFPLVVVPVQVALANDDLSRFDTVVLHELAHVRARDVSLVSAVRGIAWITVPIVALASVPEFIDAGQTRVELTYLVQAGAFVAAAIVIAAGLLRLREISADRQAVRWLGSAATLRSLLDTAEAPVGAGPRRSGRWWHRPLARHPSLSARIAALRDPLGARDAGFAYALAAGAVAAMAMDTCYYFASILDEADALWLPPRVWAAAGGVVLGLSLVPAFLRSATRARRAGLPFAWWKPVAGVGLGLLVGSVVPPSTTSGAVISVVVGSGFRSAAAAVILACSGAGMAALAAGLASLAADRFRHLPSWLTVCVTVAASCCIAAALISVSNLAFGEADLHSWAFIVAGNPWRWLLLLYPATVIVLEAGIWWRRGYGPALDAAKATPDPSVVVRGLGRQAWAVVSAAITPVCAAVAAGALFLSFRHPSEFPAALALSRWIQESWWVAVFTGWAVLVILALAGGIAGLARACVLAWLATLLVSAEGVAYAALVGGPRFFGLLHLVEIPSVWLFYLALPASLLALIHIRPSAVPKRPWLISTGASAGAAAVATLVVATGIPSLLGPAVSTASVPQAGSGCERLQRTLATHGAPAEARTGQVLTDAEARKVIAGVCSVLTAEWASDGPIISGASARVSGEPAARVTVRPTDCAPLAAAEYLSVLSDPLAAALGLYHVLPGSIDGNETLAVVINSFARSVPFSLFSAANRDLGSCRRYTVTQSGGTLSWTVRRFAVPGLGVRAWGIGRSTFLTAKAGSAGESTTQIMAITGHDLIIVNQQTVAIGIRPPPNYAAITAALTAALDGVR
jgi:Zn-dependent protease with chaperone function